MIIKNYKFHGTQQYRNVVKHMIQNAKFKGYDSEGVAIIDPLGIPPVVKYTGTVKLHGTNASIVAHKDGIVSFHSKSQLLGYLSEGEFTLNSDNCEFAQTMCRRKEGVAEVVMAAIESCSDTYGEVIYPIKISGEWCGCFHANTPILLSDGSTKRIGEVVNQKLPVEVMSYNKTLDRLEPKKVTNWFKNGKTEDWLTITSKRRKRGGKGNRIIVTPMHNIFMKANNQLIEVPAVALKVGDIVLLPGESLPRKTRQFIMGSLLGDGSISYKRHFTVSHSLESQPFYSEFIRKLIPGSFCQKSSGYNSSMESFTSSAFPFIEELHEELLLSGTKQPTLSYLNKLGPIGLASWYMDDGSLIDQGNGRQPQCEISSLGFSLDSNNLIEDWLNSRGYECYLINRSQYSRPMNEVRLTPEGTCSFLEDIAPYILPEFNYKLPEYLRDIPKIDILTKYSEYEKPLIETVITSIYSKNPYKEECDKEKYDIEVEDNHNYFANQMLVHNSGIQKGVGISNLDKKSLFIFGVRMGEQETSKWLPQSAIKQVSNPEHHIFNLPAMYTKEIEIDFKNPAFSQNALVEETHLIEKECPISRALRGCGLIPEEVEELIGEGLVWVPTDAEYCYTSGNWFKTKGEKHSVSKVKSVAAIDPEKLNSIQEFVEYSATVVRLEQGLQEVGLDEKKVGAFIGWVNKDINKEEGDVLEENNLTMKDVGKYVANKSREFYLEKLNAT